MTDARTSVLTDTHCHVDAYPDPVRVLDDAHAQGVRVVAVTEDPGSYRALRTRLGRRDGVDVALGLHPLRAGTSSPYDLTRFFRLLPQAVWIGEIGLDFSRVGVSTRRQQLGVFEAILAEPLLRHRPVTVHSRGAERDTIYRLAQARVPAVLHWYSGPPALLDEAFAAGLWVSVNPAMSRSRKGAALLQQFPPERVLLETDGPFARWGNRPTAPPDLHHLLEFLAVRWGSSVPDAYQFVASNQARFEAAMAHPS